MSINLDALEATARAATPGPWRGAVVSRYIDADGMERGKGGIYPGTKPGPPPNFVTHDWLAVDAAHIATFDPPTALALIAELRQARECVEKVRDEAERWLDAPRGEAAPVREVGRHFRTLATYQEGERP